MSQDEPPSFATVLGPASSRSYVTKSETAVGIARLVLRELDIEAQDLFSNDKGDRWLVEGKIEMAEIDPNRAEGRISVEIAKRDARIIYLMRRAVLKEK